MKKGAYCEFVKAQFHLLDPYPGGDLNTDPPGSETLGRSVQLVLCFSIRLSYDMAEEELNDETEVANIGQEPDNPEIR